MYGGKGPAWLGPLLAAEDWGKAPWEIDDGPAVWYIRWIELQKARQAKRKLDEMKAKSRRGRSY